MIRSSGILLHITSLPSKYGVGSIGKDAIKFMDWLVMAKQTVWQVLPLTQTDSVFSPYSSCSVFAGNTMLIDIDKLVDYGYLTQADLPSLVDNYSMRADFERANSIKNPLYKKAFIKFCEKGDYEEYNKFIQKASYWLEDYALYTAIKEKMEQPWYKWEEGYKLRNEKTLMSFSVENAQAIKYVKFLQYIFFKQWKELRNELKLRALKIMGDIPMYVNYDSSDVWSHPELFSLKNDLSQDKVAGVPPDYFCENGQLWGNPVYNWKVMRKNGYEWWRKRIENCEELYDILRIDHFRAFDAYWQVDYGKATAKDGTWIKGEGMRFIKALKECKGRLKIVAEDLGESTSSLNRLLERSGIPGMKVIEFAFDGGSENPYLPHNYSKNCVAYLGTHDNDTLLGWWNSESENTKKFVYSYSGMESDKELNRKMMKMLSRSIADIVIFTMQDILGLAGGRMNTPGTVGGENWRFCINEDDLKEDDALYLASLSEMYGR